MENQFKNKYLKLRELIGGNVPAPPTEPGCWFYITEGKQEENKNERVEGRWVKDGYGSGLSSQECLNKRKEDLMEYYGVQNEEDFKIHSTIVDNVPEPPTEPGCYFYITEGKQEEHKNERVEGRWIKDVYGSELSSQECLNKRKEDLMGYYGVQNEEDFRIHSTIVQPPAPELYNKVTGEIRGNILEQIPGLDKIPDEFKAPELKSAMVWGALNRVRDRDRDRVPGLERINEALVNYITSNQIMINRENDRERACKFVRAYDELSKNEDFVNDAPRLLGLN